MAKLTKRVIDAAKPHPTRDIRLWADSPRGFGLRIKPSGVKTFFVQYRSPVTGKKVRHTIGQYGRLSLDKALEEAGRIFGGLPENKDLGMERRNARAEARTNARTVGELCDDYMRDAWDGKVTYRGKAKKASTLVIDEGRIRRHIKPLLGHRLVTEITPHDITAFMHDVRLGKTAADQKTGPRGRARVTGGAGTAARTVDLLGSLFSYAVKHGLRPDNPVARFERPPTRRKDRALIPGEYRRLGEALDALEKEGTNPVAIAAIRALALTGCRRSEILSLRRDAVDAHRQVLRFADTKAGQQLRPVGRAALDAIRMVSERNGNPSVFPAAFGDGHLVGVKVFRQAVERAGLQDVTMHTLRHSYASVALELEYSELTIAGLLGHRSHSVTSRYAHHVDRALVAAADRVSRMIAERMGLFAAHATGGIEVIPLPARRA